MSPPGRDARTTDAQDAADERLNENDGYFGSSTLYRPGPLAPPRNPSTGASDQLYVPFSLARPPVRRSRSHRRGTIAAPPPRPSTPSPFDHPGQWDTITIAGVLFLGIATPEGETGNDVDTKHHKGRDGGRTTDKGAVAAEFTIVFRWWDTETWASWCQVFAAIDPQRPVEQRGPVDVSHPALAQRKITRLYVGKITFPKRVTGGEWEATARVTQWLPSATDAAGGSVTRTRTAPTAALGDIATAFTGITSPDTAADPAVTDSGP